MDIQKALDALSEAMRETRSDYHLTLGGLIEVLENSPKESLVYLSVGGTLGQARSYRGYYHDLAFENAPEEQAVGDLLPVIKNLVGQTFEGYKGGEFRMGKDTPLWVSSYGECSGVALIGHTAGPNNSIILVTKEID